MRTVILPIAAGLALVLLGHPLAGVLVMSITVVFGLRLLERQFTEKLAFGLLVNRKRDALSERILDGIGNFIQQFTGSFFACILWMTRGDLSLITPGHWIAAMQTGLASATVLQIIQQLPQSAPLLKDGWRAFITTSLVVSSVDRCIHPGHFGGPFTEALLTGMSAYGLNLTVDGAYELFLRLLRF